MYSEAKARAGVEKFQGWRGFSPLGLYLAIASMLGAGGTRRSELTAAHWAWARVGTWLVLAMLAAGIYRLGLLAGFDNRLCDVAQRVMAPAASADIVIVAIDDSSLRRLGRWPWPRGLHARLIERLTEAGARSIGLDVILAEPDRNSPDGDKQLAAAIRASGRVVLPVLADFTDAARQGAQVVLPLPELAAGASGFGHVEVETDPDGVARLAYLEAGDNTLRWPALPVAMLRGTPGDPQAALQPGGEPVWRRGRPIRPVFADSADFRRVSFADVLEGQWNATDVAGKWVLVGATAKGLAAEFTIPSALGGERLAGVDFQAQVLNALLQGTAIHDLNRNSGAWLTLALTGVPAFAYGRGRLRGAHLTVAFTIAAALLTSGGLLIGKQEWFSPIAVILVVGLAHGLWISLNARQTEHRLQAAEQRALATLESVGDAVFIVAPDGLVEYLNPDAERLTGIPRAEAEGEAIDRVLGGLSGKAVHEARPSDWLARRETVSLTCFLHNRRGEDFAIRLRAAPIQDGARDPTRIMLVLNDVTDSLDLSESHTSTASEDSLTHLPSRDALLVRVQEALDRASRAGGQCGVMFIGIDDFRAVADRVGLLAGDELIKQIAGRLRNAAPRSATTARWGGAEFVVLVDPINQLTRVDTLAEKLNTCLAQPFDIGGESIHVGGSIGIGLFPQDGQSVEIVLSKANTVMHQVRECGGGTYSFYSRATDDEAVLLDPYASPAPEDLAAVLTEEDRAKLDLIRRKSAEARAAPAPTSPARGPRGLLARWWRR